MPNLEAKTPQIQFDKMGGLNERPSLNSTPAPDFPILHALYQKRAGSLQRLEGTRTLAKLPSGVGVLGGNQLDDGTGNIIVEGDNGTEYLFTLAELFGRTIVDTLVYLPLPDDNNMPTAIIIQDAANGAGEANIGGITANTWYTRPLTANPVNESGIVISFSGNLIELAAGTYRVRGFAMCAGTLAIVGGSAAASITIGYQTAISDTTTSTTLAIGSPEFCELQRSAQVGGYTWGPFSIKSQIDYTFTIAGPSNSFVSLQNAYSTTIVGVGALSLSGGTPALISATLNGAALTQRYVELNIAKIS